MKIKVSEATGHALNWMVEKAHWPVGTRPLGERRQTQYAAIRDDNKIVFRLHRTNVVEWYGPTSMRLDSSYDSRLTRDFADNFIPSGIRFYRYREEGAVLLYDTDKMMCRGIHLFTRGDDGVWRPDSVRKPRRTVVDKDQAAVVNEKIADFLEYARAIFAVSGNDGTHPWLNTEAPWEQKRHHIDVDALATKDPDVYEKHMHMFLSTRRTWGAGAQYVFALTSEEVFVKAVRAAAYKAEDCYIKIDYDAPVPRRTKR